MNKVHLQTSGTNKHRAMVQQPACGSANRQRRALVQATVPKVSGREQSQHGSFTPSELAILQRAVGNRVFQKMMVQCNGDAGREPDGTAAWDEYCENEPQTSTDLTLLSNAQLQQRLLCVERSLTRSTPDSAPLEKQAEEIRNILAEMRKYSGYGFPPGATLSYMRKAREEMLHRYCLNTIDSDKIIVDHRVEPAVINRPGDKVTFTATFACIVRHGGLSELVTADGSTFMAEYFKTGNKFTRTWVGRKLFPSIGTYTVEDGTYHHELKKMKYATKGKTDLWATGPNLKSPSVQVNIRGFGGTGGAESHDSPANVELLARIIQTEMSIGNELEQEAVAWCVRNQMLRLGTVNAATACAHFQDQSGQAATPKTRSLADRVLNKPMAEDITSGAVKFFSPHSMPPNGGRTCINYDCSGGRVTVINAESGKEVQVYTPGYHKTMKYVPIEGVRDWHLRVYSL